MVRLVLMFFKKNGTIGFCDFSLNKIDDGVIIPVRKLGDSEFLLKRNDNRYALPLPAEIIELTGMPQNPR